jgi:hypothetical protein
MTSEVIEGHMMYSLFKNELCLKYFFLNLILPKHYINANIMKTQICDQMKYDLKGHVQLLLC